MDYHFIVPDDGEALTGGSIYNRRIAQAMTARGWPLERQALAGAWPEPEPEALQRAADCLAAIPDQAVVMVDGLVLGGMPDLIEREAERLRFVALVHLPLAAEYGLGRERLARRGAAENRALLGCRRIVANSHYTCEELVARGFRRDLIDIVTPGTQPAPLAEGSGTGHHLIAVGTVTPRKGQDLLVEALATLTDLDWYCRLVGSRRRDPDFFAQLRARIAALGLEDRVELSGEHTGAALEDLWSRSDIAVLASRYEGFGMVLTEAVARGLPVVATAGGAVAEAVPEGAGLLTSVGDVDALAASLREVLSDDRVRQELAAGARAARSQLADWEVQAAYLQAALAEAAA